MLPNSRQPSPVLSYHQLCCHSACGGCHKCAVRLICATQRASSTSWEAAGEKISAKQCVERVIGGQGGGISGEGGTDLGGDGTGGGLPCQILSPVSDMKA